MSRLSHPLGMPSRPPRCFDSPGYPCCQPPDCECAHCDSDEAPCEWEVVIEGMADDDLSCDCSQLDGTYIVSQPSPQSCQFTYTLPSPICGVSSVNVSVTDTFHTLTYRINVILRDAEGAGLHIWSHDFGATKPNCKAVSSLSLTHLTDVDPVCDSGAATATVSAL